MFAPACLIVALIFFILASLPVNIPAKLEPIGLTFLTLYLLLSHI